MLRLVSAFLLGISLISCSGSNFSGSSSGNVEAASPAELDASPDNKQAANGSEPNIVSESALDLGARPTVEVTATQCLAALNGEATDVITLSQGEANLDNLPENSIVLLNLSGQATVDLSSTDVSKVGGICIAVKGQSNVSVDFSGFLAGIFYYSRGNAETSLNFGMDGELKALVTDVTGDSFLELTGDKLECENLALNNSGSSQATCNNDPI